MRRSRVETGKRRWILVGVAVVFAGATAAFATGWPLSFVPEDDPSPATAVARRFPMIWNVATPTLAPQQVVARRFPQTDQRALFDPAPVYPVTRADAVSAYALAPPAALSEGQPHTTGALGAEVMLPRPRPSIRSNAVLNDAQIASIKERLQLTPEQERHWPAMEAALRRLTWKKPPRPQAAAASSSTPTVDLDSAEVERLKAAAVPLMLSFSPEQKREVRALANVVGLQNLLAAF